MHWARSSASRGPPRWRHRVAADADAHALGRDLGDGRLAAGLLLEHGAPRARVGVGGSQTETSRPITLGAERVVAQDAGGEALVGDHHALVGGGAQDREVEPDVLDDAVVLLEGHPVADPQRLRDGEQDPGHRVGERPGGRRSR